MSKVDTSSEARMALAKRVIWEELDFDDTYDGLTRDFYDAVTAGAPGVDNQTIGEYLAEMVDPKCHAIKLDGNVPGCSECRHSFH